jgi:plasmid maintenance system antidote protein VapI
MFSYELVNELKKKLGTNKDSDVVEVIPAMNKGNLSSVKTGRRNLTEEQALFIAHECGLSPEWVLVQLAEETAKSEEAKDIWHNLAKKINKSVSAAILALIVVFGGLNQNSEPSAAGV